MKFSLIQIVAPKFTCCAGSAILVYGSLSLLLLTGCARQFPGSDEGGKLVIDSIVPTHGVAGTPVRIFGKGFSYFASDNKVSFSGTASILDPNTAGNALLTTAPFGGVTGPVSVSYQGQTATGPVFTYDSAGPPPNAPVISDVTGGQGGDFLVIGGTGFDPVVANDIVQFNGQTIPGFQYNSGELQLPSGVPANSSNPLDITVTADGLVSNVYTYYLYPTISSAVPDTVIPGQSVTLNGLLFGNQQGNSSVRAYYISSGGTPMYMSPQPTILSWSNNTIQVSFPNYSSYLPLGAISEFYIEVDIGSATYYGYIAAYYK